METIYIYNLTKYDKIQFTDTTKIKYPNQGGYLLPSWRIFSNDRNISGKKQNFIRSTKTNSPTGNCGATNLPPIGHSFMYIETSSNNHGANVFCNIERTHIIQISIITFYYNRFSGDGDHKTIGRFRIQLLLEDNTWSTQYTIAKNEQYSNSSTVWLLLILNFTVENYGNKLIYDEIDTALCDMCFSNIMITHSVY